MIYQQHKMNKDCGSLVSFVAFTAGLLVSNIGTTYIQKQAFSQRSISPIAPAAIFYSAGCDIYILGFNDFDWRRPYFQVVLD